MNFRMVISLLKSFRVVKFNVAVCNLDYTTNARWYFLNHLPGISKHVHINFEDENYFNLVVKNNAWSIVYAFIKQRTLNFKMNNYVNQS